MKSLHLKLSLLLLAMQIICITPTTAQDCKGEHVIILSMDGFRWDYTLDAHTPTLDSLRRVGTYSQIMPVFPSNTFPNHYSMATGLHPNNHGVTNNNFYDSELGRILSVFTADDCHTEGFWGGEPIWNTVERQGKVANICMWPGSEYLINGRQATTWMPYIHDMDYYERANRVINAMSEEEAPNLVMWYMPDPDGVGHHSGPNSPECISRVEYIDQVLGYFLAGMRSTPHFEDINFIFTSDHGMTELTPERYINLYSTLDSSKVKYHISGAPFSFEVDSDYLDQAVTLLNSVDHLTAYPSDKMPEKYHYGTHPTRIANITIIPEMGWKLEYSEEDGKAPVGGSHGYDPFESDMQMVFFGAGPDFKKGYQQATFQNLNMYLILCYLTQTTPAPNDCNWESVSSMFE